MTSGGTPLVAGVAGYVEQYCEDCHEQTDQEMAPGPDLAACLRCGRRNRVQPEEDRIRDHVRRVREDEVALLQRLRNGIVPGW